VLPALGATNGINVIINLAGSDCKPSLFPSLNYSAALSDPILSISPVGSSGTVAVDGNDCPIVPGQWTATTIQCYAPKGQGMTQQNFALSSTLGATSSRS
jgi:hypothetical protein